MANRFKGLDLIDGVPKELWMEVHVIVQEVMTKTFPKNCKNAKCLSQEALQITEKRSERQRRKEKIYPSECRVPKNSKERQENFSFFDGALFFLYFIFYVNLKKNRELCYFLI